MRFVFVLLSYAVLSCASPTTGQSDDRFTVSVQDNPERQRFDVSVTSHSPETLCLSPEFWPNAHGWMPAAPQTATVTIGAARYPIDGNYNAGFCPGDECSTRVEPGATVTGFIIYQRFAIPLDLVHVPKVLDFSPRAHVCEIGRER
jgi:hypothetical protein